MTFPAYLEGRAAVAQGPEHETLTCTVSSTPESAKIVRNAVACYLAKYYPRSAASTELLIAVGEAVANAVEHGASTKAVTIVVTSAACTVNVTVEDYGPGFDPHAAHIAGFPPPESERGRGFPLIAACTDAFRVESRPEGGTKLLFSRRVC